MLVLYGMYNSNQFGSVEDKSTTYIHKYYICILYPCNVGHSKILFLNNVESNQIWIIITIFRLIWWWIILWISDGYILFNLNFDSICRIRLKIWKLNQYPKFIPMKPITMQGISIILYEVSLSGLVFSVKRIVDFILSLETPKSLKIYRSV